MRLTFWEKQLRSQNNLIVYLTFLICLILAGPLAATAQSTDSTLFVKQFPGKDVGTRLANAQAACGADRTIPCFLVIDASLAAYASGSFPQSTCTNCFIVDFRNGPPTYTTGVTYRIPIPIGPSFPVPPINTGSPFIVTAATSGSDCVGSSGTVINLCAATSGGPVVLASSTSSGGTTYPGVTSDGANGLKSTGNVQAVTFVGPASIFPKNIDWIQEGASVSIGYNSQGDTYISAQSPGSGYSGTGTCTVNGGTSTTAATCAAFVTPGGGLVFALTNSGSYSVAPTSISFSGFTGGSGASATISLYTPGVVYPFSYPVLAESLPALAGRVSNFVSYATSGTAFTQASTRYTTNSIGTQCANGSHTYSEVVYAIGFDLAINAVNGGGLTGEQAYSQYLALAHQAKADGCVVVASTAYPATGVPDGARLAFNKLLRNGKQGVDWDALIDFGVAFNNPADFTIYSSADGLHLNAGGQAFASQIENAALMVGGLPVAIQQPPAYASFPATVASMDANASAANGSTTRTANTFAPGFNQYTSSPGGSEGGALAADGSANVWVDYFVHSSISGWRFCDYPVGTALVTPSQESGCTSLKNPASVNASILVAPVSITNVEKNSSTAGPGGAINTFGVPSTANSFATGLNYAIGNPGTATGQAMAGDGYLHNYTSNNQFGWKWCTYAVGVTLATPSQETFCIRIRTPTASLDITPNLAPATTGSIGGGALLAGACASGTVAVANSTTAMGIVATPATYPGDGNVWYGYVSAAGTVTVKVCAIVAGTPTASAYNVRTIQ